MVPHKFKLAGVAALCSALDSVPRLSLRGAAEAMAAGVTSPSFSHSPTSINPARAADAERQATRMFSPPFTCISRATNMPVMASTTMGRATTVVITAEATAGMVVASIDRAIWADFVPAGGVARLRHPADTTKSVSLTQSRAPSQRASSASARRPNWQGAPSF